MKSRIDNALTLLVLGLIVVLVAWGLLVGHGACDVVQADDHDFPRFCLQPYAARGLASQGSPRPCGIYASLSRSVLVYPCSRCRGGGNGR